MKARNQNKNLGSGIDRRSFMGLFGGATALAWCPAFAQKEEPLATMKIEMGRNVKLNLIFRKAEKEKILMEVAAKGKKSIYFKIDHTKFTKEELSEKIVVGGKDYTISLEEGDKIVTDVPDTTIVPGPSAEKGFWKKVWNWIRGAVKWLVKAFGDAMKWVADNWETIKDIYEVYKKIRSGEPPVGLELIRDAAGL